MASKRYVRACFTVQDDKFGDELYHEYMVDWDDRREVRTFAEDADAWLTRGGTVHTRRDFPPACYKHIGPQPFPKDVNNA